MPRTVSGQVLQISKEGGSSASLGNLCQCSGTCTAKKCLKRERPVFLGGTQPAWCLGLFFPSCRMCLFSPVELHEVPAVLFLQPARVPLDARISTWYISCFPPLCHRQTRREHGEGGGCFAVGITQDRREFNELSFRGMLTSLQGSSRKRCGLRCLDS